MENLPAVLYVEDDPLSRKIMKMLLCRDLGLMHVTLFSDSDEFLTRIKALEPKPDLIFLDIHMKPLNGFEMLDILRNTEQFHHTPVVALTASVMNEEIQQLKTTGFNGCLAKPIDIDAFPSEFEQIVQGEEIWHIS